MMLNPNKSNSYKKTLSYYFFKADMFSDKLSLNYNESQRIDSNTGTFLSLSIIFLAIFFFFVFGNDLFSKSNPNVSSSSYYTDKALINNKDLFFYFKIIDSNGDALDDYSHYFNMTRSLTENEINDIKGNSSKIVDFYLNNYNTNDYRNYDDSGVFNKIETKLDIVRCNDTYLNILPNNLEIMNLANSGTKKNSDFLSEYFCINLPNNFISYNYHNKYNWNSYFKLKSCKAINNINISNINNAKDAKDTNNVNKCFNNSTDSNFFIEFNYIEPFLDLYDNNANIKKIQNKFVVKLSKYFIKSTNIELMNNLIKTDLGAVFNNYIDKSTMTINNIKHLIYYNIMNTKDLENSEEDDAVLYYTINFTTSSLSTQHLIKYLKFQTLLAQLTGIMSFIIIFLKIITKDYFNYNSIFVLNSLIGEEVDRQNKKIKLKMKNKLEPHNNNTISPNINGADHIKSLDNNILNNLTNKYKNINNLINRSTNNKLTTNTNDNFDYSKIMANRSPIKSLDPALNAFRKIHNRELEENDIINDIRNYGFKKSSNNLSKYFVEDTKINSNTNNNRDIKYSPNFIRNFNYVNDIKYNNINNSLPNFGPILHNVNLHQYNKELNLLAKSIKLKEEEYEENGKFSIDYYKKLSKNNLFRNEDNTLLNTLNNNNTSNTNNANNITNSCTALVNNNKNNSSKLNVLSTLNSGIKWSNKSVLDRPTLENIDNKNQSHRDNDTNTFIRSTFNKKYLNKENDIIKENNMSSKNSSSVASNTYSNNKTINLKINHNANANNDTHNIEYKENFNFRRHHLYQNHSMVDKINKQSSVSDCKYDNRSEGIMHKSNKNNYFNNNNIKCNSISRINSNPYSLVLKSKSNSNCNSNLFNNYVDANATSNAIINHNNAYSYNKNAASRIILNKSLSLSKRNSNAYEINVINEQNSLLKNKLNIPSNIQIRISNDEDTKKNSLNAEERTRNDTKDKLNHSSNNINNNSNINDNNANSNSINNPNNLLDNDIQKNNYFSFETKEPLKFSGNVNLDNNSNSNNNINRSPYKFDSSIQSESNFKSHNMVRSSNNNFNNLSKNFSNNAIINNFRFRKNVVTPLEEEKVNIDYSDFDIQHFTSKENSVSLNSNSTIEYNVDGSLYCYLKYRISCLFCCFNHHQKTIIKHIKEITLDFFSVEREIINKLE